MKLPKFLRKKPKELYTIAFYNVENLFDITEDKKTLDKDFIPSGDKKWNQKRYEKKLNKIAHAISSIGNSENKYMPVVIGLAEVENEIVLQDLLSTEALKDKGYDYIHYHSPDERGIDTAFLYRKKFVTITSSKSHELYVETPEGLRDFTRDILQVSCSFLNEDFTFLINHWPSRRDGSSSTAYKRLAAANLNIKLIENFKQEFPQQHTIVMGDFNDDPQDVSVEILSASGLFNPMETLLTNARGTTKYKGQWNLFDQILMSYELLSYRKGKLKFKNAAIYDPDFLKQNKGRYKGTPYRTFGGRTYTGGYSDHFPVYILLER